MTARPASAIGSVWRWNNATPSSISANRMKSTGMPSTSMGSVMALEGERPFRSPQCPDCSRKRPWSEQQWTADKCQKATYAAQRSKIVGSPRHVAAYDGPEAYDLTDVEFV